MKKYSSHTVLVVLTAWLSRILSAIATLYSMRVLSSSLSPSEYSVFIVLIGLLGWFALSDLGVGYALQNTISRKATIGDSVSSELLWAYSCLLSSTSLIAMLAYLYRSQLAIFLFHDISGTTASIALKGTVASSAIILSLTSFFTLSSKVLYGNHKGYIANILACLSTALGVLILSRASFTSHKVEDSILALYGPMVIVGISVSIFYVLRPIFSRSAMSWCIFQSMLKESSGFFLFYTFAAAALQFDYLIISQRVGDHSQIIEYFNLARLFALASFVMQAILFAAWPRFTSLYSTGSMTRISANLRGLTIAGICFALCFTLAILVSRNVLSSFFAPGGGIEFQATNILSFGIIAVLRAITDPCAILLQSIGRLKPLILTAFLQASISLPLQWYLSAYYGITGILFAIILSFLLTAVWALPLMTKRSLITSSPLPLVL